MKVRELMTDLRGLTVDDLTRRARELEEQVFRLRLQSTMGQGSTIPQSRLWGQYPQYTSLTVHKNAAQAIYHSGQLKVTKRYSHGLDLNLSYAFSKIITSGTSISKGEELERICRALRRIRSETGITPSCSLGIIDLETAQALREAGAGTYHHNLETARSFFPQICSTHEYDEDVETVRVAKKAGMGVCCGGIFGLGETASQRIELAFTLKELDADSIPINFLNPIEGTRLAGASNITPMECLITVALYRLILPDKMITVCGGREHNLRDLQSWIFLAGASGTMIGNYLTTVGRPPEADWQMLKDLGLDIEQCSH